jgi:integrase
MEIIKRNMEKFPEGKIFRNSRNEPWTKFAVCARFQDISKRIGKRVICYEARHGFVTRKLKEGVGVIDLAEIAGHANGNMIATVYQHVGDDHERLREMLD